MTLCPISFPLLLLAFWNIAQILFCVLVLLRNIYFFQIKAYEKLETAEERRTAARIIYDNFIMKELLAHSHVSQCFLRTF